MIPEDDLQAEYFSCNGSDPHIVITIRRPPVSGEASTSRVVDNLHSPAQLAKDLFVRQCRHRGMSVSVNGDVTSMVVNIQEDIRILPNIYTNHKMSSSLVVVFEELVELD